MKKTIFVRATSPDKQILQIKICRKSYPCYEVKVYRDRLYHDLYWVEQETLVQSSLGYISQAEFDDIF